MSREVPAMMNSARRSVHVELLRSSMKVGREDEKKGL